MKNYLQNIIKSIYQQKRVYLTILTIVAYIIMVCIVKADAEAQEMTETTKKIAFSTAASAAQELEVKPISNDYEDKAAYYRELYGPDNTNIVAVNGYEFEIIPGAPYSVYEAMANGLEEKSEIVEVEEETRYSERVEEVNTGILHNSEEDQFIETSAISEVDTTEAAYTPEELRYHGTFRWNGSKWTWYSEKVLPGGGLDIPGRHLDEDGFVCDEDGYICLAADIEYISRGTIVDTPFGRPGKIYDCGCAYGTIDVYVGW